MKDGDAELRIQRAMDRLFPSPMQEASSSCPPVTIRENGTSEADKSGGGGSVIPSCRPWDRSDLFRRLATFKSISWFGKPTVAGPVACARRGWVNVEMDLIACEVCGSRLSFSFPANWTKQQAENAALTFSKKLDSGHKPVCPWKRNACAEELAAFVRTPALTLVQGYDERLQLLQSLSAVPVVSSSAIDHMRISMGPKLNHLLSPSDDNVVIQNLETAEGEAVQKLREQYESFCQAQKVISLCGWELRRLPYSVEHHDSKVDANDSGPKVSVAADDGSKNSDPASAVLECGLCRASVGLWRVNTLSRSSMSISAVLETIQASAKKTVVLPTNVEQQVEKIEAETDNAEDKEIVIATPSNGDIKEIETPCKAAGLDLTLTIAGGPRPTRLFYPPGVLPASIPLPGLFSQQDSESRKLAGEQSTEQLGDETRSHAGSSKRKRVDAELEEQRKRSSRAGCSSVNAVETSYQNKHENSPESVECSPHEPETNDNRLQATGDSICVSSPVAKGEQPLVLSSSSKEFDPIHQHRYFCPWICASAGERDDDGKYCGWQLTVDALYSQQRLPHEIAAVTPPKVDALTSVRKMLGGKGKGKGVAAPS